MKTTIKSVLALVSIGVTALTFGDILSMNLEPEVNYRATLNSSGDFGTKPFIIRALEVSSYAAGKQVSVSRVSEVMKWTTTTTTVDDYEFAPPLTIGGHLFIVSSVGSGLTPISYGCADSWSDNSGEPVSVTLQFARQTVQGLYESNSWTLVVLNGGDVIRAKGAGAMRLQELVDGGTLSFSDVQLNGRPASSIEWYGESLPVSRLVASYDSTNASQSVRVKVGEHSVTSRSSENVVLVTNALVTVTSVIGMTQVVPTETKFVMPGDKLVVTAIGDDDGGRTSARLVYEQ